MDHIRNNKIKYGAGIIGGTLIFGLGDGNNKPSMEEIMRNRQRDFDDVPAGRGGGGEGESEVDRARAQVLLDRIRRGSTGRTRPPYQTAQTPIGRREL